MPRKVLATLSQAELALRFIAYLVSSDFVLNCCCQHFIAISLPFEGWRCSALANSGWKNLVNSTFQYNPPCYLQVSRFSSSIELSGVVFSPAFTFDLLLPIFLGLMLCSGELNWEFSPCESCISLIAQRTIKVQLYSCELIHNCFAYLQSFKEPISAVFRQFLQARVFGSLVNHPFSSLVALAFLSS